MLESIKGIVLRGAADRLDELDHINTLSGANYYANKLRKFAKNADDRLAIICGAIIGYVAFIIYTGIVG
jgi:hypothetical protein